MNAATFAGNLTANGNTVIGNATSDTLNLTATLISSVIPNAAGTYDLGSTTLGYRAAYLWGNTKYLKLMASGSQSADWTFTFPTTAGTSGYFLTTNGSGTTSWSDTTRPTVQTFTTGSGTYTTPAGVKYIEVEMVGGGGGGAGSGTAGGTAAGDGSATTFGTTLLSAGGGSKGVYGGSGSAGGTSSLGTGPIGIALTGSPGMGGQTQTITTVQLFGGKGGDSALGGGGFSAYSSAGGGGVANTGGGGGGGGGGGTANIVTGTGGGSGGWLKAIITNPSGSYGYSIGSGGTAGGAGTSGFAGGAGGTGLIVVREFYV